jgi:energy-coupling factor transport system substrate-specific component
MFRIFLDMAGVFLVRTENWEVLVTLTPRTRGWRTVDIVVAAVIGAAFGVVFWAWGLLWNGPADAIPQPYKAVLYGVWLVPAVLGALVIRKPGAAFFTETVAALLSLALGSTWGWTLAVQGPLEGLGAELVFAAFLYRSYGLATAALAATVAGLVAGVYDIVVWYPPSEFDTATMRVPFVAITAASALIVAGLGSWALTRALADTGVLDRFPAGQQRVVA